MTLLGVLDALTDGERARHPESLGMLAYFDGWNQAVGHSPLTFPRFLDRAEEKEWRLGWSDAKRNLPPPDDRAQVPEPGPVAKPEPMDEPPPAVLELVAFDPAYPPVDGSQPCAQTDPEAWFPDKGGSTRDAKRMCFRCEFREACLNYALSASYAGHPVVGVWGGTSERERRELRRARRARAA